MQLFNSATRYGALTKAIHWLMAVLFAVQIISGTIMVRLGPDGTVLGVGESGYYNWHKSLGLVALVFAVLRVAVRKSGALPDWAPTLTESERRFIMRAEDVLYAAMFVMPVSGFVYVMTGGYGVLLFGVWSLPNPFGVSPLVALVTGWIHVLSALLLVATLAGHIGLVLRHQLWLRDGLLRRMLPGR